MPITKYLPVMANVILITSFYRSKHGFAACSGTPKQFFPNKKCGGYYIPATTYNYLRGYEIKEAGLTVSAHFFGSISWKFIKGHCCDSYSDPFHCVTQSAAKALFEMQTRK